MVPVHRQVVDRVPAERGTRPRRQLLRFVLLPSKARHLQRRTRPADDATTDAHRTRFHPALALHEQRVLRRTTQRLNLARRAVCQRNRHYCRGKPLDAGRHLTRFVLACCLVPALYPVANLYLHLGGKAAWRVGSDLTEMYLHSLFY